MTTSDESTSETTSWLIWGAMLFSVPVYGAAAFFLGAGEPKPWAEVEMKAILLAGFAIFELPVIYFFRNIFFERLDQNDFDDAEELKSAYFTMCIITWALSEAIAIYGMALAMMGNRPAFFFPFAAVSIGMLLYFRYDVAGPLEQFRQQGGGDDEAVAEEGHEW